MRHGRFVAFGCLSQLNLGSDSFASVHRTPLDTISPLIRFSARATDRLPNPAKVAIGLLTYPGERVTNENVGVREEILLHTMVQETFPVVLEIVSIPGTRPTLTKR